MFLIEFEGYDLTKYNDFLIECTQKDYSDQVIHRHHIVPKFMKGTNDKSNLIELNCVDHLKSHQILAECFPKNTRWYKGNIFSALHITNWIVDVDKNIVIDLGKRISEIRKGQSRPRWIIEKMIEGSKNRIRTPEERRRIGQLVSEQYANGIRKHNPNFKPSEGYYEKLSERLKTEQNGKDNPFTKQIQHVESGKIFACLKDAMNEFGFTNYNILNRRIEKGIFKLLEERAPTHKNLKFGKQAKGLIHVESGQIFKSIKDAMNEFDISNYSVMNRLVKENKFQHLLTDI